HDPFGAQVQGADRRRVHHGDGNGVAVGVGVVRGDVAVGRAVVGGRQVVRHAHRRRVGDVDGNVGHVAEVKGVPGLVVKIVIGDVIAVRGVGEGAVPVQVQLAVG